MNFGNKKTQEKNLTYTCVVVEWQWRDLKRWAGLPVSCEDGDIAGLEMTMRNVQGHRSGPEMGRGFLMWDGGSEWNEDSR